MSEATHSHLPRNVSGALVWFCCVAGAFLVLFGVSIIYFIQKSYAQ